jgi:hypothetical protein
MTPELGALFLRVIVLLDLVHLLHCLSVRGNLIVSICENVV